MSHAMAVFSDVDRKTRLFEWAGTHALGNADASRLICQSVWRGFCLTIFSFSSLLVTATGIIMVSTRSTTASQAGFVLSFALAASTGLLSLLELLTGLDQSMVAVERLSESEWQRYCKASCGLRERDRSMRSSGRRRDGCLTYRSVHVAEHREHSSSRPVRALSGRLAGRVASYQS
jgi:ABC-type multidrug transport system fused ATPase/permease subunit